MKQSIFTQLNRRLLLACALGYSVAAGAAAPGVETFDTDTAGFGPNTTSSVVVHIGSGGNPGGFIETRKDLTPPVFDIGALTTRADFTGDYAAGGIGGVGVDLKFITSNATGAWIRFRPDLFSNGWLHPLSVAVPGNTWNTYTVSFDPTWSDADAHLNGWLTDIEINVNASPSPAFAAVMASVDFAEVRIASVGSTVVGIDNFRLMGGNTVPESSTVGAAGAALCAIGLIVRRRMKA